MPRPSLHRRRAPKTRISNTLRQARRRPRFETLESRQLLAFDVNISSFYNLDGIANFGSAEDLGDPVGIDASDSLLITSRWAEQVQPATGDGLPNSFPENNLHPEINLFFSDFDNGNNVVQISEGESIRMDVPQGQFNAMHVIGTAGGFVGGADYSYTLHYTDGDVAGAQQRNMPDWLASITSTQDDYVLASGMDRFVPLFGGYEDSDSASVFGNRIAVDPQRTLEGITLSTDFGRLNVLGLTAEEAFDYGSDFEEADPARHFVVPDGPHLGDNYDAELRPGFGLSENDGVRFSSQSPFGLPQWSPSAPLQMEIDLRNPSAQNAFVGFWIDLDGNGSFDDPGEQIIGPIGVGSAPAKLTLNVSLPSGTDDIRGLRAARVRVSTDGNFGPMGAAPDGEVEDYRIEFLPDGAHYLDFVGIDFDNSAGTTPTDWNSVTSFDAAGTTFSNLQGARGFASPISLTASHTFANIFFELNTIDNTPPVVEDQSLESLDGIVAADVGDDGIFQFQWEGLRPGATYDLFVFGLESEFFNDDFTIEVLGFPEQAATQQPTNNTLWVNGDVSNGQTLGQGLSAVASQDGAIDIRISRNSGGDAIGLAGLGIRQRPYFISPSFNFPPDVRSASGAPAPTGSLRFILTFDTPFMSPLDTSAPIVSRSGTPVAIESISETITARQTEWLIDLGASPEGAYQIDLNPDVFQDFLGHPVATAAVFFTTTNTLDLGDADTNQTTVADDGARHIVGGPRLGASVDVEHDGLPTADAMGDNVDGDNDEDGVSFAASGMLFQGDTTQVAIDLQNADTNANLLDAWIDWNGNGTFEASEQVFDSFDLGTSDGIQLLNLNVPVNAALGETFARFRLSTAGDLGPSGLAEDGEVEDYQVVIREDAPQFHQFVGIDFDRLGSNPPLGWNTIASFAAAGQSFDGLLAENAFASPYTLTLASSNEDGGIFDEQPDVVPTHRTPLDGIDNFISASAPTGSTYTAVWSDLRPFAAYELYVMGLDNIEDTNNISVQGANLLQFTHQLSAGQLWINSEVADAARDLGSYAVEVIADANGEITINTSFANLAGLALQQLPFAGPAVVAESIEDDASISVAGDFTYEVTVNAAVNIADVAAAVQLTGAASGDIALVSSEVAATGANTVYTLNFGRVPDDAYTLTLLSGDEMFEDTTGADLDGESIAPNTYPSGDGTPGGDRVKSFTLTNEFTWHNPALPEDVNNDTQVTVADLRILWNNLLNLGSGAQLDPAGPPNDITSIDVDNNGVLTANDLRRVFGLLIGTSEAQGEGESAVVAGHAQSAVDPVTTDGRAELRLLETEDEDEDNEFFAVSNLWSQLDDDWWRA